MGGDIKELVTAAVASAWLFGATSLCAQEREHKFVLEIGPAGEWPLKDKPNFGGNFAIEATLIENWLEIEMGLTALSTNGRSEWSGDFLFKKPFNISPTFEFMIGAGPSVGKTLNGPDRDTDVSATVALDFMFWPTKDLGWFIKPTWSINPRTRAQTVGFTTGILIGFQTSSRLNWRRARCPSWVKSGHGVGTSVCPLYPRKQTSPSGVGTSANCQQETSCVPL